MRTCFLPPLTCLVLASCGTGGDSGKDADPPDDPGRPDTDVPSDLGVSDPGFLDPGARDPGERDAAPDVPPDAQTDGRPQDPGSADTPQTDAGDDVRQDAADAFECPPVPCGLACPHGYRPGADGCPVCVCRECAQDEDCGDRPLGTCPALACSEGGTCVCDCSMVDPAIYECPGGLIVPRCGCTEIGHACLDHPEYQCPTVCTPGSKFDFPCPDGGFVPWCDCRTPECVPECRDAQGGNENGWYDRCDDTLLLVAACDDACTPLCEHIGTRSEAWYDACSGARIAWARCGPRLECTEAPAKACATDRCFDGQSADIPCPGDGTVPLCACDAPAPPCRPECRPAAGDDPEGWYDCKGALIREAACAGCVATCDKVGSKSEGWYSSCDGLIAWDQCATGKWDCAIGPPLDRCETPAACLGTAPDDAAPLAGGPWPACCPGLARLVPATWDDALHRCEFPDDPVEIETAFFRCGLCGDGTCLPPENRCNCPEDCLPPMAD